MKKKETDLQTEAFETFASCSYSLHGSVSPPPTHVSVTQHCHSPNLGGRVERFLAPASCSWHSIAMGINYGAFMMRRLADIW